MDAWKLRWIASSASLTTGLWPERCVAGTAGSTSRAGTRGRYGWPPAALSQARCVALAGRGAVRRPVVAAFGQARPRGRRGIGYGQPALRSPGVSRLARYADVSAAEAAGAPDTLGVTDICRVFTRRSRVRVPRLWRRCAVPLVKLGPFGPTVPLRSELAGSGRNYGPRRVMRANVCVNAWRARGPAMAGQAKRPAIAGQAPDAIPAAWSSDPRSRSTTVPGKMGLRMTAAGTKPPGVPGCGCGHYARGCRLSTKGVPGIVAPVRAKSQPKETMPECSSNT